MKMRLYIGSILLALMLALTGCGGGGGSDSGGNGGIGNGGIGNGGIGNGGIGNGGIGNGGIGNGGIGNGGIGNGGIGNGDGGGKPIVGDTKLPELNELTDDADNQSLLLYATIENTTVPSPLPGGADIPKDKVALWAVDPTSPAAPHIVEDDLDAQIAALFDFLPIHKAQIVPGTTVVDSFTIDRVIYASRPVQQDPGSTEFAKIHGVSADPSVPINNLQPVQISSETSGDLAIATRRILQFDLTDPDNTALAYSSEIQNDSHLVEWQMILLGDDDQTAPRVFPSHYAVTTTIRDTNDVNKPGGWLVIDLSDAQTLKQVDLNGGNAKPILDQNGNEIENIKFVDMIGSERVDGSQFLAITFDDGNPNPGDDDDPLQGELWYFKRSDDPNTNSIARPLFNSDGEKLYFDMKFLGIPPGAAVPDEEYIVTHGDDLYFFKHEGAGIFDLGAVLYRANDKGWEKLHGETVDLLGDLDEDDDFSFEDLFDMFDQDVDLEKGGPLVTAGDYLVWATEDELKSWHIPTGELKVLDDFDRYHDGSLVPKITISEISMAALGSRDGWVFYNRTMGDISNISKPVHTEYAVAVRIDDPSTEINIANARWIGASSTGTSSDDTKISRMELSEVFLFRDNGDLSAVSAANPSQGVVKLGNLSNVKKAALQGPAPGPYRLIRIMHNDDSEEVVFVNTREKDSLVRLTKDSGRDFKHAWPIRGF